MKRLTVTALLMTLAALASPSAMSQSSGQNLMREGNELFRDGLYRVALLRYREASAAGLDSPLLHYNIGVTSYRVGLYDDAEAELEIAISDPRLAPTALYNLGLTSQAKGETASAESWFRLALEQANGRSLRTLSERALDGITNEHDGVSETRFAGRFDNAEKPRIGEFNFLAVAGFGQDDNIYRTPSAPYIDRAQAGQPLVTPVVQSGSFMPLDLLAEYVVFNRAGGTDLNFRYVLNGAFYDSQFSNADEVSQRFELGFDTKMGSRDNVTLRSALVLRDHRETSFDPDDGLDREIGGINISNRFSYRAAGVKADFDHALGNWTWGLDARLERRHYDNSPPVSNFDHEFYFTRAQAEYAISDSTRVNFGGRYYQQAYDQRRARNLNGDLLSTNLPLRYTYRGVALGVEQDFGRLIRLEIEYLGLDRTDEFVGYNDYDQDTYRIGATIRPGRKFRLSIAVVARRYDYARAFAFNDPTEGQKDLETVGGELAIEYGVTPRLTVFAELSTEDITSTDARTQYARSQSMLGLKWRQ